MVKNRKLKSLAKPENRELMIHSVLALLTRGGGAVASFLMNIVIARYLGATQAGYIFLAITVTTLLSTVGRVGADNAILRFVSVHNAKKEWGKVHAVVHALNKWVFWVTTGIAVVMCVFARQISIICFHKPDFQWPLFWTSLSMPFFALSNTIGMALQGRKQVIYSVTTLKISAPIFFIVLCWLFAPHNYINASIYYTVSNILAIALGYYWWYRYTPYEKGSYDVKTLWKSCLPLWLGAIMQQFVIWGGQFVAGIYNSPAELAQLAVARNTSVLITFVLTAINYVSAPKFAELYSMGKMEQLKRYARNTTWLMILASTPFLLVLWFFPGFIMSLFGKGFHGGVSLLRIMAVGQYISVITGSVGYLLIMSGHEGDMLNIRIINGVGAIVLAFILNPIWGAVGSAVATSVAMASSNLMALGLCKKRLGFSTLSVLGIFISEKKIPDDSDT